MTQSDVTFKMRQDAINDLPLVFIQKTHLFPLDYIL